MNFDQWWADIQRTAPYQHTHKEAAREIWNAARGAAPVIAAVDEREAFEAAWEKCHSIPMNTRRRDDGRYGDCAIQVEWEMWQASAARGAAPAVANGPIPMVLHCPKCGLQHVDGPETTIDKCIYSEPDWDNPPHRSHLCDGCKHIWRPADVPTTGVQAVQTTGKADSPIAVPAVASPDSTGVDWLGLALELESRVKTVESQTTERAMLAAAHGLRLMGNGAEPIAAAAAPAVAAVPLTADLQSVMRWLDANTKRVAWSPEAATFEITDDEAFALVTSFLAAPDDASQSAAVEAAPLHASEYESGTCACRPGLGGKITLNYKSSEAAEAAFEAITDMLNAELAGAVEAAPGAAEGGA